MNRLCTLSLPVMAVLAATMAACGLVDPDPWEARREQLEQARAVWESAGIDSYVYDLTRICYACGGGRLAVTVTDGVVTGAVGDEGEPVPEGALPTVETVGGLFDVVERAIDREADGFEVRYDPELGYPTLIDLDPDRHAIDEEIRYEASDLVPIVPLDEW